MSAEVCASCDPNPHRGRWDYERCIGGDVYGPCTGIECGSSVCLYVGACECACHQPEKERT